MHSGCTWNISVDLQQMEISEENLSIYKPAYLLVTERLVAPMWVVSWHPYFKKSHGKAHLFIHGLENYLNYLKEPPKVFVMTVVIPMPPKWKLETHDVSH